MHVVQIIFGERLFVFSTRGKWCQQNVSAGVFFAAGGVHTSWKSGAWSSTTAVCKILRLRLSFKLYKLQLLRVLSELNILKSYICYSLLERMGMGDQFLGKFISLMIFMSMEKWTNSTILSYVVHLQTILGKRWRKSVHVKKLCSLPSATRISTERFSLWYQQTLALCAWTCLKTLALWAERRIF
jgi:hypothetical protein